MIITIQTNDSPSYTFEIPDEDLLVESRPGTYKMSSQALYEMSFAVAKMAIDNGVKPNMPQRIKEPFNVGQIKVNVETPDPKKVLRFKTPRGTVGRPE